MQLTNGGYTYILTNAPRNTVLYVGVTANLSRRHEEHKNHEHPGSFTARYNTSTLIYFERHPTIEAAIKREKEIKKWRREKKEALINTLNPEWKDLSNEIL